MLTTLSSLSNYLTGIKVKLNVTPVYCGHCREDGSYRCSRTGADLGGGCRGCPPPSEMTCGFLIRLVFCKKKKTMWFIGVEVEQEMSAPPPKKNPGSAPVEVQLLYL